MVSMGHNGVFVSPIETVFLAYSVYLLLTCAPYSIYVLWSEMPTLSLSFSFNLASDLSMPSSSRSISRTLSPERVLRRFLNKQTLM